MYCPNIISVFKPKRKTKTGHMKHMGVMGKAYGIVLTELIGKSPLGKPRRT
jgi:hypothetical protein